MSRQLDDNSYSSANAIAVAGLNLALSFENASVERLEKRLSECIVPEVKQKILHHLDQTKKQQERLRERIRVLGTGMAPTSEKGRLAIPEPPHKLKMMIESSSSDKEREVWESLNDLIIERAEAIMYRGGIQALQLLKADKKTIKELDKCLKEEAFGDWLEKNNPKVAKRLMTTQIEDKKQGKKKMRKTTQEEKEEEAVSAAV